MLAFHLIVHEVTDFTTLTQLELIIKYFSVKSRRTNAQLLALVEANLGKVIDSFNAINQEFQTCKLEQENLKGFMVDTTNTMQGRKIV